MTDSTKSINKKALVLTASVSAAVGATAVLLWSSLFSNSHKDHETATDSEAEKKPLYWVAPMDSNYRRDKPGKSPMGMDLVPVYEETNSGADDWGPGVVNIAPHIVNNLGVRTELVASKVLNSSINTVGYVQYDEDDLVHIHPRVEGWIDKLFVKVAGSEVQKGEPLYTLYSPQLVNAQEEMLIALKRKNKTLINAAKERLLALHLTPEFIKTLESSQQVQQNITFYSPQSGVVDGLNIREGFFVQPGTTLFSIAKLDHVWVEAEVFERDSMKVRQGQSVIMTLDYAPAKSWQGTVDYVYPSLNEKTRTLRVRLKFKNTDFELKPNMYANVAIQSDSTDEVLVVSKEALIRTGLQDRVVLAIDSGQFKSIEVQIGRITNDYVEVLSGLNEDDKVVTSAQFLIDSESSKQSDFKRMDNAGHMNHDNHMNHGSGMNHDSDMDHSSHMNHDVSNSEQDSASDVPSATVDGEINFIDQDSRVINISRGPIEKWNREAATMDFVAAEHIDLSMWKAGDKVRFTFEIRDDFVVVQIDKAMDHSGMDHSNMDHSNMEHSVMENGQMNHDKH